MKKIAICGLACAGKTTAYKTLGIATSIKFAQPHYDVLKILGVEKHRGFMQEFSDLAKKHFGEDIFVKIFENKTNLYNTIKSSLACDDLRFEIEFESCLKNDWALIYIDADEKLRKERSDKLGLEWHPNHNSEKAHLFKEKCHYIIENNGGIEDFKKRMRKINMSIK